MGYPHKLISTIAIAPLLMATALLVNQSNSPPLSLAQVLLDLPPQKLAQINQPEVRLMQNLPPMAGVTFGAIQYQISETQPDALLEAAIRKEVPNYTQQNYALGQPPLRYFYNRVDLNQDGKPEVITYLSGRDACGSGGCTMLIFKPLELGYQLLSRTTITRNPILVSNQKTKGWNDLILFTTGGSLRGTYVRMRFDGKAYPPNPSLQPAIKQNTTITGTAVIADQITTDSGIPLQPGPK